jgi:hypothetical protein
VKCFERRLCDVLLQYEQHSLSRVTPRLAIPLLRRNRPVFASAASSPPGLARTIPFSNWENSSGWVVRVPRITSALLGGTTASLEARHRQNDDRTAANRAFWTLSCCLCEERRNNGWMSSRRPLTYWRSQKTKSREVFGVGLCC